MDGNDDPNKPDCTNGDFFCNMCLASMNSEAMWSSHIAGKRHIKNSQKFPNGIPKRRLCDDEDSYDRPSKHERLDSDYDWENSYPPGYDDYYEDGFHNRRPPVDYVPIIKPNVVFDYGHIKKLEDDIPPPQQPPQLPSLVPKLPAVLLEPKKEENTKPDTKLDEVLNDIVRTNALKRDSEVHDDFFEKINRREMAKDIAKELSLKRIFSNDIKAEEKEPKAHSSSCVNEKYSKRKSSDIFDILHELNEKKLFNAIDKDDLKKRDSPPKKSSHNRNSSQEKSSHSRYSSQEKSSHARNSSREKSSHTRNSSPEKSSRTRNSSREKSSHTRNSSPEKSSHTRNSSREKSLTKKKEKSDLDSFDPDKLTPDVLDDLLSVHLKPKVTNSGKSQESKSQKHSVEEEAKILDDPEVLAEKLNALPTIKCLEMFHKILKNVDLKDSEELNMVLKIIAASQELVCNKFPPNLQAVLNAKMPGRNTSASQNAPKSENPTNTSVTLSSQSAIVSQNYPTVAPQPQDLVPMVPVAPPFRNVVSQSQTPSPGPSQAATIYSQSTIKNTVTSQNPAAYSAAVSVNSTASSQNHTVPSQSTASLLSRFSFPSMPSFPRGFPMPPALMNPMQAAVNQPNLAERTPNPLSSQSAWQNYQMYNYYRVMQYMCANRQTIPSNVNSVPSTSQPPTSKQTEQSKDKSSEQSKDKSSDYSKSKSSEYSKDNSSDYSKSRSSEYSKDKSSEYSKDKSSEYSKDKSSEYSKDKSLEYLKNKYSDYSKNKHSDYSNSKSSEYLRSKQIEPSKSNLSQNLKSSMPNQLPATLHPQSLQASKELLETLKKLQELSEEYKKSTSAKKTKNQ